jgi:hypothetical protein
VVDPACGSGAFLVGMLHVLVELYRLIYSHIKREMTGFELKKKVIGNSLYNEAKRSFEHADVNTIIALIDSPLSRGVGGVSPSFSKGGQGGIWPALRETARFVMFKKPFEEAINTKNLLAIEKADSVHKAESYRVYPVKQETLLEEGWEQPEEEGEESVVRRRGSLWPSFRT